MAKHSLETAASLHFTKVETGSLAGAQPGSTPTFIGQERFDTVLHKRFVAKGISAATDWVMQKGPEFAAVVHSTAGIGTHTTLGAVMSDANVPAGSRVLVLDNLTDTTTISVAKRLHIVFAPGVSLAKTAQTTGINFASGSSGSILEHARFSGFTTGGDKPVNIATGVANVKILFGVFASGQASDVTDVDGNSLVFGTLTE